MAFQPVPNTALLALRGNKGAQLVENVFGVQCTGGWDLEKLTSTANAIATWMVDSATLANFSNDFFFTAAYLRDINAADGLAVEIPAATNIGTAGGNPMPNNVSFAIHKVLNIGGRHAKGRVYHMAPSTGMLLDENHITASTMTNLCNLYRSIRTVLLSTDIPGIKLGMIERVAGGTPLAEGIFWEIVDFICRDNIIDSQRRRLPGRGR